MPLIFVAFLAGILTALAPCVLPIIPVVIGGSISDSDKKKPYIVVFSLFVSIIIFTLLLKGTTLLIDIPDIFWKILSGLFIILFGLTLVFPQLWDKITAPFQFYNKSQRLLAKSSQKKGYGADILIGFALGPVFSSCSPVYLFILSAVLPTNFGLGIVYIISYALGLCMVLLLVGIFGQKIISKFEWAINPYGWFKRGLGVVLIISGIFIISGLDRAIQQYVITSGFLDITQVEKSFLK